MQPFQVILLSFHKYITAQKESEAPDSLKHSQISAFLPGNILWPLSFGKTWPVQNKPDYLKWFGLRHNTDYVVKADREKGLKSRQKYVRSGTDSQDFSSLGFITTRGGRIRVSNTEEKTEADC